MSILVVNAATGEFEAGFESGGQTREHAMLVRSFGVKQMAVAVNKMDTVSNYHYDFSMSREVVACLIPFLWCSASLFKSAHSPIFIGQRKKASISICAVTQ